MGLIGFKRAQRIQGGSEDSRGLRGFNGVNRIQRG